MLVTSEAKLILTANLLKPDYQYYNSRKTYSKFWSFQNDNQTL